MDPATGGAYLCLTPGGLARSLTQPAPGGRGRSRQNQTYDGGRAEDIFFAIKYTSSITMISRRDFFGMTAGLTSAGWAYAQETQRPTVFKVKVDMVVLSFTVTDSKG